ncbi:hypothetical protein BCR37DRAFT_133729 [Protomyces lactucae-debilis]|uniref:HTH CENPB-type domain-containing protein n=1 Tax=Protomyces lactucae-debilis TaxID=2754530 RepID=A0A1Y2FUZ6_PROLT|nr:uncharacterized protein BCR37DRAFT_133729 [Protomyces lactucae-debilis]ORY86996.1 hypothetical protein BCR37DRAFT_133729 [Protomyces lactucae-debilis]
MVMDFASTLAGRQLGQHWVTRFMARHKADSATSNKTWEPRTPIVAREPQHLHSARPATGYGTFSKAHKIRSFVNRVSAGCSPGQRKAFKYLGYHYTKLLANHTAMLARIEQLEKANSEKTRSRQRALTVIEQMGAVQSQPGVFMDDETAELRRELLEQREEVKRQQQAITAARKEAVAQKKADKEPQIQQRREARAAAIIARNAASAAKKAAKAAKQAQKEADLESKPSQAGKRFALRTKNGDTAARSVAATTAVEVPLAALTTRSGRVSVRPSHKRT